MSDVPDYPEIVPKSSSDARGIDFCGTADYHYIIRSDLGVYMKCTNFNAGSGVKIYALSEACKWGDHYLAITVGRSLLAFQDDDATYFYIIKGNEYCRVTNMAEDNAPVVYSLHPNCRGGSSYYSAFGNYYIIFADRGVYRRVTNMNTDEGAVEYRIHEAFQDGIYFWGVTDSVYCLKRAGKWGLSYHRSTNMNKDYDPANFSVHTSVINFLPGGLAQTKGKAFGYWEKLASFKNVSGIAVDWERTIKESVGFKKSEMSSIEHDWSIEVLGAQHSSGALTEAICKYQFSLKAQYGGKSVNTHQQDWNETTEQSETVKMQVPPNSEVYVWQYQMGFGQEKSLFCADLQITDKPTPPEKPPKWAESASPNFFTRDCHNPKNAKRNTEQMQAYNTID